MTDAVPRVSVLLATHNDERFLGETLESLLGQTYDDFEIVAVDDASTDATPRVLAEVDDRRLTVLRNDENQGLTKSLNRGLTLCRGEFVARIDGDDVCEPERLARQIALLDADASLDAVCTWTREIDENGVDLGRSCRPPNDVDLLRWSAAHNLRVYHPTVTIRRRKLLDLGGYDERFRVAQDFDLWARLWASGGHIGVVEAPLVRYRRTTTSLTRKRSGEQRGNGLTIATRHCSHLLGQACDARAVEAMRALLTWEPATPKHLDLALPLMAGLRRAALASASAATRRLADAEVAGHLVRRGREWLKASPMASARIGRHLLGLPGHRREGVALLTAAARCGLGRLRSRHARR